MAMTTEELIAFTRDAVPSAPDSVLEERIYTEYIKNGFIIYNGKENKAVCTRCGEEWDIYPGEYAGTHGSMDYCPCCGEKGILLSAGRGRNYLTEYHRVLSFMRKGNTLIGTLNSLIVDFSPFGRPTLHSSIDEVYVIDNDVQQKYKKAWDWHRGEWYWNPVKSLHVTRAPSAPYCESKWHDHVFTDGLMNLLAETDCKYLADTKLILQNTGMSLPAYFATCMKYHSVELLAKGGFNHIAQIKINGCGHRAVNWRAKSLEKILKLSTGEIRKLRQWDVGSYDLALYQAIPERYRKDVDLLILRDWEANTYSNRIHQYIDKVEKYMPFDKWLRWAKTQTFYKNDAKGRTGIVHLLHDYEDYIEQCRKLGMDITKKSVLRPADLRQAHEELNERIETERNEAINKAIAANNAAGREFKYGGLMVIAARSQEDLNKESASLCHCVKTYGNKLAKGRCFIFFIRHVDKPSEPYYTLETTTSGEFVQCRGLRNCSMTDEVQLFTDAFVKKLQNELRRERKAARKAAQEGGQQILCPAM